MDELDEIALSSGQAVFHRVACKKLTGHYCLRLTLACFYKIFTIPLATNKLPLHSLRIITVRNKEEIAAASSLLLHNVKLRGNLKMWKLAAVLALSMALAAGYALAQPGNGPGRGMKCQQRFATLDADKDGKVSLAEFMSVDHPRGDDQARQIFAAKDADGDELLTAAEFCPRR